MRPDTAPLKSAPARAELPSGPGPGRSDASTPPTMARTLIDAQRSAGQSRVSAGVSRSRRHRHDRPFRCLVLAAAAAVWTGCYGAEFDPEIDGVYACTESSECEDNFVCVAAQCRDDRGPSLTIQSPEKLQVIDIRDTLAAMSLTLRGSGLNLVAPGAEHVAGQGHVEIELNGKVLGTIEMGFLESSITVGGLRWPQRAGMHRIRARALRNDETPYENPSASTQSVFWVDNGSAQVGVVEPAPWREFANGEIVDVEIQALNFQFVAPGSDIDSEDDTPSGHVHLFYDKAIPSCLPESPSCNGGYLSIVAPPSGERTRSLTWTGELTRRSAPGEHVISVVLEDNEHQPYPSDDPDDVAYDNVIIRIREGSL